MISLPKNGTRVGRDPVALWNGYKAGCIGGASSKEGTGKPRAKSFHNSIISGDSSLRNRELLLENVFDDEKRWRNRWKFARKLNAAIKWQKFAKEPFRSFFLFSNYPLRTRFLRMFEERESKNFFHSKASSRSSFFSQPLRRAAKQTVRFFHFSNERWLAAEWLSKQRFHNDNLVLNLLFKFRTVRNISNGTLTESPSSAVPTVK